MYIDDLVWSPSSIYLTQVVRHEHDLDIVEIASSIGDKFVVRAVVTNLLHKRWLNYALVGGLLVRAPTYSQGPLYACHAVFSSYFHHYFHPTH